MSHFSSIVAALISDATAAGRSLLTAATTAAQHVALGLGTAATKDVGTGTGKVTAGDDARLSDARTPTAHASAHATGGGDALTASDVGAVPTGRLVAGAALSGDVSAATLASALGLPTYPAVVALVLTDGGGSHGIYVTATVTIGGVAVSKAIVEIWVHYPSGNILSWAVSTGTQVSIANPPSYPGANSTIVIEADASGVARAFYGGTTTGGTLYAAAQSRSPASAVAVSTRTIPA